MPLAVGILGLAAGLALGAGVARYEIRRPPDQVEPRSAPPSAAMPPAFFAERLDVSTFQRGNIHTHSLESDGDRPPEEVFAWYRDHGYAFVALTDHNKRIDPNSFRHLERPGFVIIPGEEITMTVEGTPVHVNAICAKSTIGGGPMPSRGEALGSAIRKVREQGGAALINHPNARYGTGAHDSLLEWVYRIG